MAMDKYGGSNKFRELFGYKQIKKSNRHWTFKNTLRELKKVIAEIGHFPTHTELSNINYVGLLSAMKKHGGTNRFRELLGYEIIQKSIGYWTEERIISELKIIKNKLNHFPSRNDLSIIKKSDLYQAINRAGGLNRFRELLGDKLPQRPGGYWTYENTLNELNKTIDKIGRFPTRDDRSKMKLSSLFQSMNVYGGSNKFRKLLGYELIQTPKGHWNDKRIIIELKAIHNELKHFPTQQDLCILKRVDLIGAIRKRGGINKFREVLGYPASLHEQYLAESASYSVKRGKNTEMFVKTFLIEWCKANKHTEPAYNKRLGMHSILEFVCSVGKTIGIDVVNTKDKSGHSIRRKYRKKNYHKYVDELWIVVFSNVFTGRDYRRFNEESPDNVRVMPIDVFLKELDISTDEHLASKIDAYNNCTFRTKDEFVKRHLNRSIEDYV